MNLIKNLEPGRDGLCQLHTMEGLKANGRWEGEACQQDYYRVFWVKRGSGLCDIDLLTYPVEGEALFIVPPGAMHRMRCSDDLAGYVLVFDTSLLFLSAAVPGQSAYDPIFKEYPKGMVLPSVGQEERRIMEIMNNIVRECEGHSELQREMVSRLVYMLLLHLHRLSGPMVTASPASGTERLVHRFRREVERNFITKRMVGEYARDLQVSSKYLSAVVRQATGNPASYHIQQRFILEAKRLARFSGVSMTQIAYCLGFETPSHFSKFFRKMGGMNFSEFRNGQRAAELSKSGSYE